MRLTLLLFFTAGLCVARPLFAADKPLVVDLWPGKVPDAVANMGEEKTLMSQRLTSKQVEVTEPTRMVTNVSKPTITICRPPKDQETGTAMLICPGGGYWNLYWQLEGEEVAAWLNSQGITGIILKYRVPRQPDEVKTEPARRPLLDAQRAVSLVRSKASEWGIDPKRIGIIGFSAGGHLALATATRFEKRAYAAVDAIDEVSCRPDFAILCYPGYLKAPDKEEFSAMATYPSRHAADFPRARRRRHHQQPRAERGCILGVEARRDPGGVAYLCDGSPRLRRPRQRPSLLDLDGVLHCLATASGIAQGKHATVTVG